MLAASSNAANTLSSTSLRMGQRHHRHAKSQRHTISFHATNSIGSGVVQGMPVTGVRNKRNTAADFHLRRRRQLHHPHRRVRRVSALVGSEQQASASTPSTAAVDKLPRADDTLPAAVEAFLRRKGRHAVFKAAKGGSVDVNEVPGGRTLMEYMWYRVTVTVNAAARDPRLQLPASQYSTLDGEKVERISDDTFRCTLGSFEFFGFRLQPVLTAEVDVKPGG